MKKHHHAGLIVRSEKRGAGEGTARSVQRRVCAAVSRLDAAARQTYGVTVAPDCIDHLRRDLELPFGIQNGI